MKENREYLPPSYFKVVVFYIYNQTLPVCTLTIL